MRSFIALMALLGSVLASSTAFATQVWTSTASACAVGDPAIQADLYQIQSGVVQFKGSANGTITLYCQMEESSSLGTVSNIGIAYRDGDGTTTLPNIAHVKAELIAMNKSTGVLTSLGSVISDSVNVFGANHLYAALTSSVTFNWTTNAYYIRIDVERSALQTLWVGAVDLTN